MPSDSQLPAKAVNELQDILGILRRGEDPEIEEIVEAREEVLEHYQPIFSRDHLQNLTEEEFQSFLDFENNQHWKNIHRHKNRLTEDMGALRDALLTLTDEERTITDRLTELRPPDGSPQVNYLGKAVITPILLVHRPEEYGVWNAISQSGMKDLGLWPEEADPNSFAESYASVNNVLTEIATHLDIDLWTLDALWWRVDARDDADSEAGHVWWVNQGRSYKGEGWLDYIYAPQTKKDGTPNQHYENVARVRPGDVIIHYADTKIRALSRAVSAGYESVPPDDLGREQWEELGWKADVNAFDLEDPIHYQDIPEEWRKDESATPFHKHGRVNVAYLFELPEEFVERLRTRFADRWPAESPWGKRSMNDATHLIHKWQPDRDPKTVERHREVAQAEGSTWWGKVGRGRHSAERIQELQEQIDAGLPTYAFLYRLGDKEEVWRTKVHEITTDPGAVENELRPDHYDKDDCALFTRLSDFESIDSDYVSQQLVLESAPEAPPERMERALRNQTTPMWVRFRDESGDGNGSALTMDWLQGTTFWERSRLEELVEDLEGSSPQVVLAGPPGTSKTWVAKHVARYLTADQGDRHRTVQFHPSYGYEDFIEGLRPVSDDGSISFQEENGVLLQMTKEMRDYGREEETHVLVIDEMNRANLPRVFGELMYLFEYRGEGEEIQLQYTDSFSLPEGLKFIATMNTADRSIRSIDIALRRRFDVFECMPDSDVIRQYYAQEGHGNEVNGLIDGFETLNDRLREEIDKHHQIGHTFFMEPAMDRKQLRKIWDRKLDPLIEEYFFDQPDIAAEYTLEEFWPED